MKTQHLKKILEKQFKIAKVDLKFDDICEGKIPNWFYDYTCTEEENQKWQKWTQKYIKEKLKITNDRAYIQTAWINLNYGLRVEEPPKPKVKNEKKKTVNNKKSTRKM